ncbi:heme lyase CcmF/NrfE family subunit [Micromonospora polyrhachis]|uniref:Cytochrome c-type biogenesis protein CcmF n=1 Tax=Micromonospora polyrhachis TaxID=1282883 RepID=A0A7W7WTC1_9ACTN|nr:cytochrome c-type biogenesis CcmF C-terminal domain-containing protein [Micromonospora polyrhachis]MBB4962537.1 cytochrome c-type biogenesis protein CcmF [Micromonospora polyrhachis]
MIGTIGTATLAGGLVVASAATLLWLRVALTGSAVRRPARIATGTALLAAVLTCGALEWALLSHDFTVRFVAENGGRHVSTYFTITSLWAALDGSLLLWLLILGGYATLLSRPGPRARAALQSWAMTVVSAVSVFFFALTYFAANPFRTVTAPPDGGPGPNPLLQEHPAMGLHPPLLYAGYIGLVIPFGYAVAALLVGRPGTTWLRAARGWALLSWSLLTAGIALGAWWSYAVLGWGGYWAWDPVENASLLPWLTTTAFLHATLMSRRRPPLAGWDVTLACASFLLVLVGTFLTRSGSVESVHAFTESALGPMLLVFVLVTAVVVVTLIGWRARSVPAATPPSPATGPALSRQTTLLGNGVLLTTLAAVVLIGTVLPLVAQALTGVRTAVGPPYFNRTAVPLAVAAVVLMGIAPLLHWRTGPSREILRRLAVPGYVGLAVVAAVGLASRPGMLTLAAFGGAAFVLTGTGTLLVTRVRRDTTTTWNAVAPTRKPTIGSRIRGLLTRRRAIGGLLAHIGVALVTVGVAASSAYSRTTEREIAVGQTMAIGGTAVRLATVEREGGAAEMRVTAQLVLTTDGKAAGSLRPELRYFPARDMTVSVPGIRSGLLRDRYATLLAVSPDGGRATIRLAVNPLVSLLWAGSGLTVLGGLLAIGRRPRPASAQPATTDQSESPVAVGEVGRR